MLAPEALTLGPSEEGGVLVLKAMTPGPAIRSESRHACHLFQFVFRNTKQIAIKSQGRDALDYGSTSRLQKSFIYT